MSSNEKKIGVLFGMEDTFPWALMNEINVIPHVKAGKLNLLGINYPTRHPDFPDTQTLTEAGYPNADVPIWYAIWAPAGTPPEIVKRLNAEIVRIVALPDVREKLAAQDYEPQAGTPEQLAALITEDSARWQRIVKERNFKAE